MLHYIYQLVAKFVFLLFGAEQVVHSVFFLLPVLAKNKAESEPNSKVAGWKSKTISWKMV